MNRIARIALVSVSLTLLAPSPRKSFGVGEGRQVRFAELEPTVLIGFENDGEIATLLYRPADVVVTGDGSAYVLDAGNGRLAHFDASGRFQAAFGRQGQGPGEFGMMSPSDKLVTDGSHLFVLSAVAGEVQVWSTVGEYLDRFMLVTSVADIATSGGKLYFSTLNGVVPGALRTTMSGVRDGTWEEPLYSGNTDWARLMNHSELAVAPDGEILFAFRAWPLLRSLQRIDVSSYRSRWLSFGWVPNTESREKLARPEGLLEDRDLVLPGHPEMAWVAFWEVDFASEVGHWYVLSSMNLIHILDRDLKPLAALELGSHDDSRAEITRFGVSPDGSRICAVDPLVSIVRCYSVSW